MFKIYVSTSMVKLTSICCCKNTFFVQQTLKKYWEYPWQRLEKKFKDVKKVLIERTTLKSG